MASQPCEELNPPLRNPFKEPVSKITYFEIAKPFQKLVFIFNVITMKKNKTKNLQTIVNRRSGQYFEVLKHFLIAAPLNCKPLYGKALPHQICWIDTQEGNIPRNFILDHIIGVWQFSNSLYKVSYFFILLFLFYAIVTTITALIII